MGKKKKKIRRNKKLSHQPENDNSYLDTMTGTNSSNDMVILRQNVEIYIFQWIFFMRREIVDHVAWKRHCAITKKAQRYFKYL